VPLAELGVLVVQRGRDREAEDAVAQELQALVRRLAVGRRRRMRERLAGALRVELVDQTPQGGRTLFVASSGVTGAT
jgi:hypothetical protein